MGKKNLQPPNSEQVENLKRLMIADHWDTAITVGEGLSATFKAAFDELIINTLVTKAQLMMKYPSAVGLEVLLTSSVMETTNFQKHFILEFQMFRQIACLMFIIKLQGVANLGVDYYLSFCYYENDDLKNKISEEYHSKTLRTKTTVADKWRAAIIQKIKAQLVGQNIMTE